MLFYLRFTVGNMSQVFLIFTYLPFPQQKVNSCTIFVLRYNSLYQPICKYENKTDFSTDGNRYVLAGSRANHSRNGNIQRR